MLVLGPELQDAFNAHPEELADSGHRSPNQSGSEQALRAPAPQTTSAADQRSEPDGPTACIFWVLNSLPHTDSTAPRELGLGEIDQVPPVLQKYIEASTIF